MPYLSCFFISRFTIFCTTNKSTRNSFTRMTCCKRICFTPLSKIVRICVNNECSA